tara:strand:+ start:2282 stop:2710 length:429 start_codon:yes stop_codon:yes gene_type:complete
MIILSTSAASQKLSVIPREYLDSQFTMTIRDDSTNITEFYNVINASISVNYLTFENIFNPILVNNHFFDLHLYIDLGSWNTNFLFWNNDETFWNTIKQTNDIYKDRIFCTDQDINELDNDYYELNKGKYTFYNGYNNTYKVR